MCFWNSIRHNISGGFSLRAADLQTGNISKKTGSILFDAIIIEPDLYFLIIHALYVRIG